MLKISIIENCTKRQLVLEGKLVAPWTNELKDIGQEALIDSDHRELIIDLRSVTALRGKMCWLLWPIRVPDSVSAASLCDRL